MVYHDDGDRKQTGLDILILENFAKKNRIEIEYIKLNDSLIEVFSSIGKNENLLKNETLR